MVALATLGSGPSAVTVSDALIMGMEGPVDCTDRILISKARVSMLFIAKCTMLMCYSSAAVFFSHHCMIFSPQP